MEAVRETATARRPNLANGGLDVSDQRDSDNEHRDELVASSRRGSKREHWSSVDGTLYNCSVLG